MTHFNVSTALLGLLGGCTLWGASGGAGYAQINADLTLGAEPSVVNVITSGGDENYFVSGGALRGSNLFHSFDEFSLSTGSTVQFLNNSSAIENIISRVTGTQMSRLDGKISSLGDSNFFLINPNGIVISPNAALDIGGSFLASSASGLRFGDDFIYDVEATAQPPLLSVASPLGLTFASNPGKIQVSGPLGGVNALSGGLSVPPGQTLALLGGEVSISKAQLDAPGGRVEIGGIAEPTEVDITPLQQGFDVNFDQVSRFGDIQISGQSIVDVSGPGGGAIELQGRTISMSDGSALISDTLGALDGQRILIVADRLSLDNGSFVGAAAEGTGAGSQIEVKATKDVVIDGTGTINFKLLQVSILRGARQASDREIGGFFTTTTNVGQTGNITVTANNVLMDQGVAIATSSLGTGKSGDIKLAAREQIRVSGSGIFTNSLASGVPLVTSDFVATGRSTTGIPAGLAGDIELEATQLFVEDGAAIASATVSDQNSGSILINVKDSIVLQGIFVPLPIPTSITTATIGGRGNAGSLRINTGTLRLQDAAEIYSDTGAIAPKGTIPFGGAAGDLTIDARELIEIVGGNTKGTFFPANLASKTYSNQSAGNIEIATPTLIARDGGRIISSTFGPGSGGFIKINAEAIELSGVGVADEAESEKIGSGIFADSGLKIQRPDDGSNLLDIGAGGTIEINSSTLTIQDQAGISVGSLGSGIGGNLFITADLINLEQQGEITATSGSGEGGNINLTAKSLFLDQGLLSSSTQQGDGGNLNFNLQESLLLRNNSLISTEAGTNSAGGNGGDIDINISDGFVVASPTENSDIRANAFEGDGGKVSIGSLGLLGIVYRPKVLDTPESDITSSSRFGDSGIVTINAPDVDPDSVEIELSDDIKVPRLEQGCLTSLSDQSSFVQTGRGGLPTNPASPVAVDGLWQDLEPLSSASLRSQQIAMSPTSNASLNQQPVITSNLREAIAWTLNNNGEVQLIAPEEASSLNLSTASTCSGG